MHYPPGPRTLTELLKMLSVRKKNPIKLYEDVFAKYGDVVFFQLGPFKFAMLNNAADIEQVLQTDAKIYTKSTGYQRFALIVGKGLLVSEGELWKKQRRLMSWAFSSKHIEKIYPVMVEQTRHLIDGWKDGDLLDLAEEMNRVTLQIISNSLFGKNQEKDSLQIRSSLQMMLKYLQTTRHLWIQLLLSPLPLLRNKRELALKIEKTLPTPAARNFFGSINDLNQNVNTMITARKSLGASENFLDAMIQATDSEDQSKMGQQQLRDEAVNMMIAGHETTANALTWTWHQLLKHPQVLARVKAEISSKISGRFATFEEISQLSYTKAVFEESMRLYPPFWRISRTNQHPTRIHGFDIPQGTNIIASIYTVHRSEVYWKDPLKFDPERFLQVDKNRPKFAYLPFGGGPRICIGMQFAVTEALCIITGLLKACEFEAQFQADPEYVMSLTLQPKDGCLVKLHKAQA